MAASDGLMKTEQSFVTPFSSATSWLRELCIAMHVGHTSRRILRLLVLTALYFGGKSPSIAHWSRHATDGVASYLR